MSQYRCHECGDASNVIDTRTSARRLRRRRRCKKHHHRFSTIEIPLDSAQQIDDLIQWGFRQGHLDDDMRSYMRETARKILLGPNPEESSDQCPSQPKS